jgi:hypothetical protein
MGLWTRARVGRSLAASLTVLVVVACGEHTGTPTTGRPVAEAPGTLPVRYAADPPARMPDGPWKLKPFTGGGHLNYLPNATRAGRVRHVAPSRGAAL